MDSKTGIKHQSMTAMIIQAPDTTQVMMIYGPQCDKTCLRVSDQVLHKPAYTATRALTSLFGHGAGANGIGKISGVLTKIGEI